MKACCYEVRASSSRRPLGHSGHQGINKCRQRARQAVWWPGLAKQLENLVTRCTVCRKNQQQRPQPLMQPEPPQLPWEKVGMDLFEWEQKHYLLVVDYYSRYIEIARLANTMTNEVLKHTKSIYARHGIPEVLISDNGPQYASSQFAVFAQNVWVQKLPQVAHTTLRPMVRRNEPWESSSSCFRRTRIHT